jgi:hypothetical protein
MFVEARNGRPLKTRGSTARLASIALLVALLPSVGWAGTWEAFGPEAVVRGGGISTEVTREFAVENPHTLYVLRIRAQSFGVQAPTKAVITLNGVRVLGPIALRPAIPVLLWPVRLLPSNQMIIELRDGPGGSINVDIVGLDFDSPTISGSLAPSPEPSGWLHSSATVTFTCADRTSGVASCPSPATLITEGGNQIVQGTVTDKAGHQATTKVSVNIDLTAPIIRANITPPPNSAGWNSSPATVTFECSDPLSGIASCSSPVTVATSGTHQIVTGMATDAAGNTASVQASVNIATDLFSLRNVGGRCLTFGTHGAGAPVYLRDCDGSPSQQVRIVEVSADHRVYLGAGTGDLVIGLDRELPSGGVIQPGDIPGGPTGQTYRLETQVRAQPDQSAPNQYFLIDGDSIILAADRSLVFQLQDGRNANDTPIVSGPRHTADAELWEFNPIDGSDRDPTSGFVRVGYPDDPTPAVDRLLTLLYEYGSNSDAHTDPNTVIKIYPGTVLDLSGIGHLELPDGVTIRGDRSGTQFGPIVCKTAQCDPRNPPNAPGATMFEVVGDNVRISGLRLQGTSRSTDKNQENSIGVFVADRTAGPLAGHYTHTIIDHNDISNFTGNGVLVQGSDAEGDGAIALNSSCDPDDDPSTRRHNVLVARNFIHHNSMQDAGYGVESTWGGFPLIEGNVFVSNRHAIAAGKGSAHTGYRARFNLVLQDSAVQSYLFGLITAHTHDFDMHGMNNNNGDGFGGLGGDYVDIYANSFLDRGRRNYELRGQPCHYTDFHGNVSLQSKDDAVVFKDSGTQITDRIEYENIADVPNQFHFANPTNHLGVGDFDGDGIDDTFIATGAAWYYAPQANAEWRLLNMKPDLIETLLLGDFDGDGRSDVVGINDGQLVVSWGGVSPWQAINVLPPGASAGDFFAADFVDDYAGDHRPDIFYADGSAWYVSSGGTQPFVEVNTSSFRVHDLRFGDFDGDGKTDVFGVTSGTWSYSKSAQGFWADGYLQQSLAPVDALVVADFDGDGRADVATSSDYDVVQAAYLSPVFNVNGLTWKISYGGIEGWSNHRVTPRSGCALDDFPQTVLQEAGLVAAVGRFDTAVGADVLLWGSTHASNLCIVSGGIGDLERQSRQDMR